MGQSVLLWSSRSPSLVELILYCFHLSSPYQICEHWRVRVKELGEGCSVMLYPLLINHNILWVEREHVPSTMNVFSVSGQVKLIHNVSWLNQTPNLLFYISWALGYTYVWLSLLVSQDETPGFPSTPDHPVRHAPWVHLTVSTVNSTISGGLEGPSGRDCLNSTAQCSHYWIHCNVKTHVSDTPSQHELSQRIYSWNVCDGK